MERRFSRIYPQPWVQVGILIGFCIALYFINLGRWDLWNPDEPRYAQVAKEMVKGGDWILMHYNGKAYADKPPLLFWLIAFSSFLWQGFSSFSVRFPSAFFGTLTVLVTFFLGKTLYSSRTGFLSGLILATSFEFSYLSTRNNIDTTLTFFTTVSLLCFVLWYREARAEALKKAEVQVEEKTKAGRLLIYGFYVGMALATLAKGPVGFILPLSVSLLYLVIKKDWSSMRSMRLLSGMALFVVIVLLWYLPAVLKGGEDYLQATLFKHSIDRYAQGWSKGRPIYYYLYNFPVDFLPWIFFVPAALVYGFSSEKTDRKREFLFLLVWSAFIFLFFSLSKGKRGLYLLPLYPAVCVMVGKLWNDFIFTPLDRFPIPWMSIPLYGIMAIALVAGAAIPWILWMKFPSYVRYSLPITFLLVGGSLVMFVLYRYKNYAATFFLLVTMVAGGFFYTLRVVFPLVNPYKSARFLAHEVTARILPGDELVVYGRVSTGPFNYYTEIVPILELVDLKDLMAVLQSSKRVFCLLDQKSFAQFQRIEGRPKIQLISRRMVGDDELVLVSNR
ncbi:MAG: ArnT family glycosyltransferase [Thermodesulfobacteriota bacterium]